MLAVPAESFEAAMIIADDMLDARETDEIRFGVLEVLTDPKLREAMAERMGTTNFYGFVAAVR